MSSGFHVTRDNVVTLPGGHRIGRMYLVGRNEGGHPEWVGRCSECSHEPGAGALQRAAAEELLVHWREEHSCRFCEMVEDALKDRGEGWQQGTVYVFPDAYPVTPGHHLIIPIAHRRDFFDLTSAEHLDTRVALRALRHKYDHEATGSNIGWNVGEDAGQTVMHAHCHFIPRRRGDMDDPTGGVRGVIPEKRIYTRTESIDA